MASNKSQNGVTPNDGTQNDGTQNDGTPNGVTTLIYDDDLIYDDIPDINEYIYNIINNYYMNDISYMLYNNNYIPSLSSVNYIDPGPNYSRYEIQLNNIQYTTIMEFLNSFH